MKRFFVILFFITFTCFVNAQLYVSSGATVFVGNDATFTITGNAKNDGTIVNPGTIHLSGNLDDTQKFLSTGSLVLSGKDQTLFHKNNVFGTLVCNGGGIKKLTNSITITNNLELNDGLLKPLDSTFLLLKKTATTTTGNSDSYIDGKLFSESLIDRYFPIGRGGLFAPCEFHSMKGDSSIIYGVDVVNPTTLTLKKGKLARGVLQSRYWEMTVKSGTYNKAYLSLSYTSDDIFLDPSKVGVVEASDSAGAYDMLLKREDITSRISKTGLFYSTSQKNVSKKFFTLGDFVDVYPELLYVPNALSMFSPDSNDRAIRVYGHIFDKDGFTFVVSNQWGNIVFKTNSITEMAEKGWDGINSRTHRRETTGQYLYVLKGVMLNGEPIEKAGSIWIID